MNLTDNKLRNNGKITGLPCAKNMSAASMTTCEEMHLIAMGCPFEDKEQCIYENTGRCLMEEKHGD